MNQLTNAYCLVDVRIARVAGLLYQGYLTTCRSSVLLHSLLLDRDTLFSGNNNGGRHAAE